MLAVGGMWGITRFRTALRIGSSGWVLPSASVFSLTSWSSKMSHETPRFPLEGHIPAPVTGR